MDELTRLALAARGGDQWAFAELVRATQAEVWRFCAHLGDAGTADDLAQETYVRAYRALPAFRAEASARTWLLAIARRAAADAVRASRRRSRLLRALPRPQAEPDAAEAVGVAALVAGLDDERRAAFVSTQLLGLSYAEAAEVCGCAVGTIRSRVARARAELVDALRAAGAAAERSS